MAFAIILRRFFTSQLCPRIRNPRLSFSISANQTRHEVGGEHIANVLSRLTFPKPSSTVPRIFSDDVDQVKVSESKKAETEIILRDLRKARNIQEKLEIYRTRVLPAGRSASEAAFRHMIGVAAAMDNYDVMVQVYRDRKKLGYMPTDRIALWLARVATRRGHAEMITQVFQDFKDSDMAADQSTLSMLIALAEKLKSFAITQEMYAAMIRWHGQPDNHSYNVIIRMCCRLSHWEQGISYAEENLRRATPLSLARETRELLEALIRKASQIPRAKEQKPKMQALYRLLEQHSTLDVYS